MISAVIVLGTAAKICPEILSETRTNELIREFTSKGPLTAFAREASARIQGHSVGCSAVDAILYLLDQPATRRKLMQHPGFFIELFAWLDEYSVVADDGNMDGIPTVLYEAMCFARPVIASELSGIPEVLHPGKNGILTPPGDVEALAGAIETIVSNPERASAMGQRAREFVATHHDYRVASKALLGKILAGLGR